MYSDKFIPYQISKAVNLANHTLYPAIMLYFVFIRGVISHVESQAIRYFEGGIEAILQDECFTVPSQTARMVITAAQDIKKWTESDDNKEELKRFEEQLVNSIESTCFSYKGKVPKKQREKMWSGYQALRVSTT